MVKRKMSFVLCMVLIAIMSTACGDQAVEKQVHTHTWVEATCTTPKTCSECGATEGEAKGHTVQIGTCANCGQAQGKDIVDKINQKLADAYQYEESAVQMMQEGASSSSFDTYKMSLDLFTDAKDCCAAAYELCGDYEELADVKKKLKDAVDSVPTEIQGFDSESHKIYAADAKTFIAAVTEAQLAGNLLNNLF